MLAKEALLARLAEGHAARLTVVTPNRRLARALTAELDALQIGRGRPVWEAADILPFDAWVQRLWEDALYTEAGGTLPLLLTQAQEQAIWEAILQRAELLSVAQTARQCRDAWRLLHAWRIAPGHGGEDAAAFREWAAQYEKRTAGEVDAARLPDMLSKALDALKKPQQVVAYAFDILPPQTKAFLAHFALEECRPEPVDGAAAKLTAASARDELEKAAAWARGRLEEGRSRIGVVVPELALHRKEVVRVFSRVMQPAYNLPGATKAPLPFNVSLGEPLADYPLVDFALSLIELSLREVDFAQASRLVRSPFLGGAEAEMARRARLDAKLRQTLGPTVSLAKLVGAAEPAPQLRQLFERIFALKAGGKQGAGAWARHFSALLEAAGFPGERPLDSAEFQTRAKWHETLGELAKLEPISKEMKEMTGVHAVATLRQLCAETLFQPESPEAPIQVLGVLESAGLRFDCLWVSGLTDEAWPLEARPNPFIPVALQKAAGVPQASAEASLALGRRLTGEWLHAAREVVFSYPTKQDDRDLAPSPLIAQVPEGVPTIPVFPRYRDVLFATGKTASIEDAKGPGVAPGKVRGGTRVLADQAACPFRAFARWRLAAEALEEPVPGPDASDRGILLHALMRNLWSELKGSRALHERDLAPVIDQAAAAAVAESGLEGRFAELERKRIAKLAREWLELEKRRTDFEVAFVEHPRTLSVAGLEFSSRIDRMDRLGDGGHVLIDYKTGGGRLTPKQWDSPRPDDPQLPLYAAAAEEDLAAVAFARLRPGDMRFMGYARADKLMPKVQVYRDWPGLLAQWRKEAGELGAAFAAGEAPVDPKRDLKTCLRCDLQTLCRVYEKFNVLEEIEDEEGAE
ncbi:MAG TPA: PD-(D/E)XK nuclease family protein [Burkholderiales bacterium]|nr:PD-(D/E)XK nuclease family protein [Burkholderiales bacterium]